MVRKRKSAPQRLDEEKRQKVTWNLNDLAHGVHVIPDGDACLLQEKLEAEAATEKQVTEAVSDNNLQAGLHQTKQAALDLIDYCEFYLTVSKTFAPHKVAWHNILGHVTLTLGNCGAPKNWPSCNEFWLYIHQDSTQHLAYFEFESSTVSSAGTSQNEVLYFQVQSDAPYEFWAGLRHKAFSLTLRSFEPSTQQLTLNLHVTEQALTQLQFDSEGVAHGGSGLRRAQQALQYCMAYLHGLPMPGSILMPKTKKHDIERLYEAVKQYHREEEVDVSMNVQHVSLRPTLRPYQCQAVRWMLYKETQAAKFALGSRPLHPLYQEFRLPGGELLFYNPHGGMLVRKRPCRGDDVPGGIIGEEMGLGKTVEVLACLLCHPRPGWQPPDPLPIMHQQQKSKKKKRNFVGSPVKSGSDAHILDWLIHDRRGESNCSGSPLSDSPSEAPKPKPLVNSYSVNESENHYKTDVKQECEAESHDSNENPGDKLQSGSSEESTGKLPAADGIDNKDRLSSPCLEQHVNFDCSRKSETMPSINEGNHRVTIDLNSKPECDISITTPSPGNNKSSRSNVETVCLDHDYTGVGEHSSGIENDSNCEIVGEKHDLPLKDSEFISCVKTVSVNNHVAEIRNDTAADTSAGEAAETSGTKRKGKRRNSGKHSDRKSVKAAKANCKPRRKPWTSSRTDSDTMDTTKTNAKQKRKLAIGIHDAVNTHCSVEDTDLEVDCESYEETRHEVEECGYVPPAMSPGDLLECICGLSVKEGKRKGPAVKCGACLLWQHATCVGFDLRDPLRGDYYCPQCHMIRPPITSGATLIISPRSISFQWVEEINRHIHKQHLKVMVYQGVQKRVFVQPQTLANHDVVITTYETLRKEIAFASAPVFKEGGDEAVVSLRAPKRYTAVPSPLVAVDWWRICLDEAQMVESTTTKAAEMALRLSTVNRWCVSGTPIQRSIEDLYGLLLFLGVEPYWVEVWWSRLLYTPYCHGNHEPLHQLLGQVLWRTAKKDVIDQICLPPQTECLHWLTFSPVEEHFYRQQYSNCAAEALKQLHKWSDPNTKLSSLDRDSLHSLLLPLTRLRQACCHPQAVRGNFIAITKSTMTMEELLAQLIKKARLECEESHRQKVAATNALAGLDIIQSEYAGAVEKYREVLRLVEEHKDEFRTDKLQQLHALHNLHEVLLLKPQGVGHTLRDSELQKQAAELKDVYMTKALTFVTTSQEGWNPTKARVREAEQEFRGLEDWWMDLIQWFVYRGLDLDLIHRVKEDLAENENPNMPTWTNRFRDLRGLQYLLNTHLEQTDQCYKTLLKNLRKLGGKPSVDLINSTVECCLRPAGEILKTCPFCKCEEVFQEYEVKLFAFSREGVFEDGDALATVGTKRQGTWADSQAEKSLKSLINFTKTFTGTQKFIEDGQAHLKLLDALKKEYKSMRKMWMALKEHVGAYDELDMATLRLRLRMPDEPMSDVPQPNIIEPVELEAQALKFSTDRIVATSELRKKRGQLLYLKNLVKTQDQLQGGENPELCPVCKGQLGIKWSVFHCGHCYCMDCVRLMADHYAFGGRNRSIRCAVCRQRTRLGDISYVCARQEAREDEIRVKGDYSTKVEGVVRCLLKIHQEEASAKVLIFSTWVNLLAILGKALEDNGIEYRSLVGTGHFQRHLFSFKTERDIRVLMLPVHSGSNGLNLIEATHVFLVEPILNTAQELQAVGRVHRIGQTKPTFVHRFLVCNTIEDKMHHLLKNVQAPVNSLSSEETTMTVGDLRTLFQEVTEVEVEDAVDRPYHPGPHNDTATLTPPAGTSGASSSGEASQAAISGVPSNAEGNHLSANFPSESPSVEANNQESSMDSPPGETQVRNSDNQNCSISRISSETDDSAGQGEVDSVQMNSTDPSVEIIQTGISDDNQPGLKSLHNEGHDSFTRPDVGCITQSPCCPGPSTSRSENAEERKSKHFTTEDDNGESLAGPRRSDTVLNASNECRVTGVDRILHEAAPAGDEASVNADSCIDDMAVD